MHSSIWTDYKISLCASESVSESVTQNELNALQITIFQKMFTKLATKVESQEMWLPILFGGNRNISIRQTGSGINPHNCSYGKISNVKYLKNGERYDVRLNGNRIENHPYAIDWHHDLWPWMTLNQDGLRSLQFQSNISITMYGMQKHWADTRSKECFLFFLFLRLSYKWQNIEDNWSSNHVV